MPSWCGPRPTALKHDGQDGDADGAAQTHHHVDLRRRIGELVGRIAANAAIIAGMNPSPMLMPRTNSTTKIATNGCARR